MLPQKLWLALGVLTLCTANAAVIYKWTDADGMVHFSDQSVPGAERVVTGTPNSSDAPKAPPPPPTAAAQTRKDVLAYTQFELISPVAEQSFFGDEQIGMNLALSPALKDGQTITWRLNGTEMTDVPANGTSFALSAADLGRGTYSIAATVTDDATGQTRSSNSVTFYVKKPGLLSPQHGRN